MRRLILTLIVLAQLSKSSYPQTAEPLSVTTRLVEVQVVVQDRHGQPVSGLTREDFVLKDRGKAQTITVFATEGEQPAAPPAGPESLLPPSIFSNLGASGKPAANSATVILLDKLNTRRSEQRTIREKVVAHLRKAGPRGRVAILALGENGKLRILADFTTDTKVLTAAAAQEQTWVSQLQRMSETDLMDSGDVLADPDDLGTPGHMKEDTRKIAGYANQVRISRTLLAMEAIGRGLAHVPGRKSLVWFSDAFPFSMGYETEDIMNWRADHLNFEPAITRAMRVLTDANVAMYPVDSRGLSGVAMADASQLADVYNEPLTATGTSLAPSNKQARVSMETMAHITGGKAFFERNDLDGALREAISDAKLVYILGYQPTHDEWDGKFRPIEVSVKHPGVKKIRYRSGYFALAEDPAPQRQFSLIDALASPFDATAIGLLGSVAREQNQWQLSLSVDAQHLTLTPANGAWTGNLDVLFVQEDAAGKRLDAKQVEVPLNWTAASLAENLQRGAGFHRSLEVMPSAVRLRVVLRDRPSSRIGSLTIPLT